MISKDAVAAFVARPRRSWAWVKRYTRADLVEELHAINAPMRWRTLPRKHQLACYLVGLLNPKFLMLLDMGLGKTLLVLMLLVAARLKERGIRALIVVPKKVHMGTWADEVSKHTDLSIECIDVISVQEKWEALMASEADVTVIDYMGLGLATTHKMNKQGRNKLVRDDKRMRLLRDKFGFLSLDEIHRAKNKESLRFGILRQLVKTMRHVYGLTGTPQGRDPQDLWAQFFLIDGGDTLGESLGLFREAFFTSKNGYFGGKEYKFDTAKQDQLSRAIQAVSIVYEEKECLDLPPMLPIKRTYTMSEEQIEEYRRLRAGDEIDGVRIPIDGVFHRMREVASGYKRSRVNGVSVVERFDENPKLDLFESDILEMPANRKAIVFYDYIPTGNLLAEMLKRNGIKCLTLDGRTKDTIAVQRKFTNDASVRVLLCNSESGSEGINAQVANYQFFYESPVSPITRRQAMKRAHRQGQERRVIITDYVGRHTVEEKILEYIAQGFSMLAALKAGSHAAKQALFALPPAAKPKRRAALDKT